MSFYTERVTDIAIDMIPLRLNALYLLILTILISGCGVSEVPADPPPSATSSTQTATVAFPTLIPPSTLTPIPTESPAPALSFNPGSEIFSDDFSGELRWTPAEPGPGGLSLSEGRLFISVRQSNSLYMAISPADPLTNAYIEIEVRPELCTANDEFGIVFRANDVFDHYRFTLTCIGEARVVGVINGIERVLLPNSPSTAIFPGVYLTNRLGVQMENDQFRFYINGEEVFSDRDLGLPNGRFGLLVKARQSGQTTASFDNFSVRILQPAPTNTPSD
jgi:hypothetical protein